MLHREGVEVDHVLDVACPKNRSVHAYAVNGVEQTVRGKSADHRTASALLAFLNKHLARYSEQVSGSLWIHQRHFLRRNRCHARGRCCAALPPTGGRHHYLIKVKRTAFKCQSKTGSFKLGIGGHHRQVPKVLHGHDGCIFKALQRGHAFRVCERKGARTRRTNDYAFNRFTGFLIGDRKRLRRNGVHQSESREKTNKCFHGM